MSELNEDKIKKAIDLLLSTIEDWNDKENHQFIIASRSIVFKKYGIHLMNYMDEKLFKKGFWKKGMPQPPNIEIATTDKNK